MNRPHLPASLLGHVDARYANCVPTGWRPLVEQLHQRLVAIDPDYRFAQVKEKFGHLTVYLDHEHYRHRPETARELKEVIEAFRDRSAQTCERCGAVGPWRNDPAAPLPPRPHSTLCDLCSGLPDHVPHLSA